MKEYPILFNGDMVRAILTGQKTQTRRPVNPQSLIPEDWSRWREEAQQAVCRGHSPYGIVGDKLYVRETWAHIYECGHYNHLHNENDKAIYRASCDCADRWRPSIHMPKRLARIWLKITGVRVERLQDIGKDGRAARDVLAEGITQSQIDHWIKFLHPDDAPAHTFGVLWDSIYAKAGFGWEVNPWVRRYEFELARKESK